MSKPSFPFHDAFRDASRRDPVDPVPRPEPKGGLLWVDGKLHLVKDISDPIRGTHAYAFSINQDGLERICGALDVETLAFKGLRATEITPLVKLPRLKWLRLWWLQKLESLEPMGQMTRLEVLLLEDFKKASDLSPLATLTNLRALSLRGGMWNKQPVQSLEPLTGLPLEEIQIGGLDMPGDEYRHLAAIKPLRDIWLPPNLPVEVYTWLIAKRPDLRCETFMPFQKITPPIGGKDIMVTGHRRPMLNAKKDAKRLEKYIAEWDAMIDRFRAE